MSCECESTNVQLSAAERSFGFCAAGCFRVLRLTWCGLFFRASTLACWIQTGIIWAILLRILLPRRAAWIVGGRRGSAHAQALPSRTVLCVLLTRGTRCGTRRSHVGIGAFSLLQTPPRRGLFSLDEPLNAYLTLIISGASLIMHCCIYRTPRRRFKEWAQRVVVRFISHKFSISESWILRTFSWRYTNEHDKPLVLHLASFQWFLEYISINRHIRECQGHKVLQLSQRFLFFFFRLLAGLLDCNVLSTNLLYPRHFIV